MRLSRLRISLANLRTQVIVAVMLGILPAMGLAVFASVQQREVTREDVRAARAAAEAPGHRRRAAAPRCGG